MCSSDLRFGEGMGHAPPTQLLGYAIFPEPLVFEACRGIVFGEPPVIQIPVLLETRQSSVNIFQVRGPCTQLLAQLAGRARPGGQRFERQLPKPVGIQRARSPLSTLTHVPRRNEVYRGGESIEPLRVPESILKLTSRAAFRRIPRGAD